MKESEMSRVDGMIARLREDPNDSVTSQELFSAFYPLTASLAARYSTPGSSGYDELIQAMRIALYDAALSYDKQKGKFATYAAACMRNRLIDSLRALERENADLLDPLGEEIAAIPSEEDLERDFVSRENYLHALSLAKEILSPFQYKVLVLGSEGYSTAEIAEKLGVAAKTVDNAKYRTRTNKRVREIFSDLL